MKKTLFILFAGTISPILFAGGFQLNMQGNKATALGGSFCSLAWDASSVFYNPGGIARLNGHQFTAGGFLIVPKVSLQTSSYDNINQTSKNATPIHLYYSGNIKPNLWIGFGLNNQFGSSSSFDPNWQGRYIVQNIGLRTFMYQPTVAYKIHEKIAIGAGFTFTTGNFEYGKAIPVGNNQIDYGKANLQGSGRGYSFNAGIHALPWETEISGGKISTGLGVSYRHKIKLDLTSAKATFTDIPSSLQNTFPGEQSFDASLTLPAVLTGGVHVKYVKNDWAFTLTFDWQRNFWSSYDTLKFDFENPETPDAETPKNWKDVNTLRWGLDVTFKEKYSARFGIYRDQTPIPDGYVSPELPDNTHTGFTGGIGIAINENVSMDASFLYSYFERPNASLDNEGFQASYRRRVLVFGLGVNVKFGHSQKTSAQQ